MIVKFKALVVGCAPAQAHESDAGWDLPCAETRVLYPHETAKIRTGVAFELPSDHYGCVRPRSSAILRGIHVAGTLDSQYRGELFVLATNLGTEPLMIEAGKRIAQLIVLPRPHVEMVSVHELGSGERSDKGFGSSGGAV